MNTMAYLLLCFLHMNIRIHLKYYNIFYNINHIVFDNIKLNILKK